MPTFVSGHIIRHVLLGHNLTASGAFTSLALFNVRSLLVCCDQGKQMLHCYTFASVVTLIG